MGGPGNALAPLRGLGEAPGEVETWRRGRRARRRRGGCSGLAAGEREALCASYTSAALCARRGSCRSQRPFCARALMSGRGLMTVSVPGRSGMARRAVSDSGRARATCARSAVAVAVAVADFRCRSSWRAASALRRGSTRCSCCWRLALCARALLRAKRAPLGAHARAAESGRAALAVSGALSGVRVQGRSACCWRHRRRVPWAALKQSVLLGRARLRGRG